MKMIPLTQGMSAIVDDDMFEYLNQWKWCVQKSGSTFYAIRSIKVGQHNRTVRMHREILGLKFGDKRQVDHINHNGLGNRRCNLRICNQSENSQNQNVQRRTKTSKYKGVWKAKQHQKGRTYSYWMAGIRLNQKLIHLGYFKTEREAAEAYNNKAIEVFGEFANVNVISKKGA